MISPLENFLNLAYHAETHAKSMKVLVNKFSTIMKNNVELRKEATDRLLELQRTINARGKACYFSGVHKKFLEECLNG